MLRQVKISGLSLNLQDPLLRLTGIHPRQTGGTSFDRVLRFRMRERPAYSNPGPVRAPLNFKVEYVKEPKTIDDEAVDYIFLLVL